MRFGIGITGFSWSGGLTEEPAKVAVAADDAGLDTVWAADHLLPSSHGTVTRWGGCTGRS